MKNEECKELISKIVEEEKNYYNLSFDVHFIGQITYFNKKEEISKRKFTLLKKIKDSMLLKNCLAFHNSDSNIIVIFSNKFKRYLFKNSVTELVFCVYHEISHAVGSKNCSRYDSDYDKLLYYIDYNFFERSKKYFLDAELHDSVSCEIFADKYAIEKTKNFFEKNKQYTLDEKYLNKCVKDVESRYDSYDLSKRLDYIISNQSSLDEIIKMPFFKIFLNLDGTFKNVDEILSNRYFHLIDLRTIQAFFKTETFRDSVDLNEISNESKQYLANLYNHNQDSAEKLNVQKHQKFKDITDGIKRNKIDATFDVFNIFVIFISFILTGVAISVLDNPSSNWLKLLAFSDVAILDCYSISSLKNLFKKIKNKYRININEERFEQFIQQLNENIEKNGERHK